MSLVRKVDIRDEAGAAFSAANPLPVEAGTNGVNVNLRDDSGTVFSAGNPLPVIAGTGGVNVNTDTSRAAFGEQLCAQLSPIIQLSFEYTVDNTHLIENTVANTGTVTQSSAMAVIGTGGTTASTALLRSHRHAKYKVGLDGLTRFTAVFTSPVAGTVQIIGLADEVGSSTYFTNGFMIGYVGTTFGFHRFQNDVLTTVALSAWDDPLDGTGTSGMTIDFTKLNVFQIQFQYLGAGAINVYVESPTTGKFFIAHQIQYANLYTSPSVYNPNFHLIVFSGNGATTSDIILKTASCAYFVEGKTELIETQQPQFCTGIKEKTTVTTEVAIVTIKNKSTYAGKNNFIDILLERFGCSIEASSANNLGSIRLIKNATLGGVPSYADINTTDSVVSFDVAGTTVTGGENIISIPLAGKNDKWVENLVQYKIILGEGETLTIAGLSANSATIDASLLWKELF